MGKQASKTAGVFKDIAPQVAAEAYGRITGTKPVNGSTHTGNVLLELSGFAGVIPDAALARDFLIKIAVIKVGGSGVPVAIAQNAAVQQPGGYTQFTLVTVHQHPESGTYQLTASIEARVQSGPIQPIEVQQLTYHVS